MKKKLLTLIVIAAIGITSCKKDELATPEKNSPKKVSQEDPTGSRWD